MDLRRDHDRRDRILQHHIDPASRGPVDGHFREPSPSRMGDPKQFLHDARLDVIPNQGSCVRIQADGQVRSERVGYRGKRRDARLARTSLNPGKEPVVNTSRIGKCPQTEPGVDSEVADLDAELASQARCTPACAGSWSFSAIGDTVTHSAIRHRGPARRLIADPVACGATISGQGEATGRAQGRLWPHRQQHRRWRRCNAGLATDRPKSSPARQRIAYFIDRTVVDTRWRACGRHLGTRGARVL